MQACQEQHKMYPRQKFIIVSARVISIALKGSTHLSMISLAASSIFSTGVKGTKYRKYLACKQGRHQISLSWSSKHLPHVFSEVTETFILKVSWWSSIWFYRDCNKWKSHLDHYFVHHSLIIVHSNNKPVAEWDNGLHLTALMESQSQNYWDQTKATVTVRWRFILIK